MRCLVELGDYSTLNNTVHDHPKGVRSSLVELTHDDSDLGKMYQLVKKGKNAQKIHGK